MDEKMNFDACVKEDSADPSGDSEAEMALQRHPELRHGCWGLGNPASTNHLMWASVQRGCNWMRQSPLAECGKEKHYSEIFYKAKKTFKTIAIGERSGLGLNIRTNEGL